MEKILNTKYDIYKGSSMLNKYIYMVRNIDNKDLHFIFKINSIVKQDYSTIYECERLYILIIPYDNENNSVNDKLNTIELLNTDILYQLSFDEYLKIFKSFINLIGTNKKINKNEFMSL